MFRGPFNATVRERDEERGAAEEREDGQLRNAE